MRWQLCFLKADQARWASASANGRRRFVRRGRIQKTLRRQIQLRRSSTKRATSNIKLANMARAHDDVAGTGAGTFSALT